MRNDMLFIGDKLMDLDDDTKVTLNFKSNIFTDLSKIISNNSYTIKLPNTIRNQCAIMHADLPSCDIVYPRIKLNARYFRNGAVKRESGVNPEQTRCCKLFKVFGHYSRHCFT